MFFFFFFNDTATTEIYTLSLHDALPISQQRERDDLGRECLGRGHADLGPGVQVDTSIRLASDAAPDDVHDAENTGPGDRKSTRLNSSHLVISYAVFCLKKKIQTMSYTPS